MEVALFVVVVGLCDVREDNEDKMELKLILVVLSGVIFLVEIGLVNLYTCSCSC